jgi:hypothetical protein
MWGDLTWLHEEYERHALEAERLSASCEALERENLMLLRRSSVAQGGSVPDWWETAESYREHAERTRLESMLLNEAEEEDLDENGLASDSGHRAHRDSSSSQETSPTMVFRPRRRASLVDRGSPTHHRASIPNLSSLFLSEEADGASSSLGRPVSRARNTPARLSITIADSGPTTTAAAATATATPGLTASPALSSGQHASLAASLSPLPPVRRRTSLLLPTAGSQASSPRGAGTTSTDLGGSSSVLRRASTVTSLLPDPLTPLRRASTFAAGSPAAPSPALSEEMQARLDRMVLFPRLARQSVAGVRPPRLSLA